MYVKGNGPISPRTLPGLTLALVALIVSVSLTGCGASPAPRSEQGILIVSAAADLTYAFQELGADFERETGTKLAFNFGSSGLLAQQIRQGAPVDVYASASRAFADELEKDGLIIPGTTAVYARGRIGLWPHQDRPFYPQGIQDLARPEVKRIAIANPEHAPYGVAARQALQSAGVWEAVKPRLVLGENVRQALQYAETGNVDVAIVALSLAIGSDNSRWILIPDDLHQPIDQVLGIVKDTPRMKEARQFIAFVNSGQGKDTMRKYGFISVGEH